MRYWISHFGNNEMARIRCDTAAEALRVVELWEERTGKDDLLVEDEEGRLLTVEDLQLRAYH